MPAILFQMKHPKNVFGSWRVPVKFTGKSDVIFSGPKLSCALRNTPKSFRELYGTVFVPEKFSGLLRNARQIRIIGEIFGVCNKATVFECQQF